MRSDARRHRTELIEAAASVFARDGYGAPLEAVLAEAGLGRGTLYRHFRDRNALVVAVFEYELDRMAAFVLENRASATLLRDLLRRHAAAGLAANAAVQIMAETGDLALLAPLKVRADLLYDQVIDDARALGLIRPGFDAQDLRLAMRMIIGAAGGDSPGADLDDRATEHALDIVLRGIRPD